MLSEQVKAHMYKRDYRQMESTLCAVIDMVRAKLSKLRLAARTERALMLRKARVSRREVEKSEATLAALLTERLGLREMLHKAPVDRREVAQAAAALAARLVEHAREAEENK